MIAPNTPTVTSIAIVQQGVGGTVTAQVAVPGIDPPLVVAAAFRALIGVGYSTADLLGAFVGLLENEGWIKDADDSAKDN